MVGLLAAVSRCRCWLLPAPAPLQPCCSPSPAAAVLQWVPVCPWKRQQVAMTWYWLLIRRLAVAAVVWALAAPLALYFTLTLLFRLLRSPRSAFWRPKTRDQPPSVLLDPKLGEHAYVTLAKGIKLHYVQNGDSSRPLMLFLHGFPEFWFSWKHQLLEFAKDYWVVALDMRGYGDSDSPSGSSSYRADILVDDIKELLEAFERPRATLVGHGWGAAVGWMFLDRYKDRVERLVSIGAPHPHVFQRAVVTNWKQLRRTWYLFLFQAPWLPELLLRCDDLACIPAVLRRGRRGQTPSSVTDEDLEAYKYTFGRPGALTGPLNYYRAAGWGLPRLRRRPRRAAPEKDEVENNAAPPGAETDPVVNEPQAKDAANGSALEDEKTTEDSDHPETTMCADSTTTGSPAVLLLLGGRDAFVEHSTAFRTRKQFPNVSVTIIRDANHFAHLDDPAAVNAALRKFLAA